MKVGAGTAEDILFSKQRRDVTGEVTKSKCLATEQQMRDSRMCR